MRNGGLVEVLNPSEMFLEERLGWGNQDQLFVLQWEGTSHILPNPVSKSHQLFCWKNANEL